MPDECTEWRRRQRYLTHLQVRCQSPRQPKRYRPFRGVTYQGEHGRSFSPGPQYVGGRWIAGAVGVRIRQTETPADDDRKRNRPDQVGHDDQYDGCHGNYSLLLSTRMMLGMQLLEPLARNMRVDLCRRYIRMAQQHLHHPQVSPVIEQMGGEGVTQGMGRNSFADTRPFGVAPDQMPECLPRHRCPAQGDE